MAQCLSFYTYCSSLAVNCYLYTDVKRTTPVSAGWVSDGTTNWTINSSGMITGTAACVYEYYAYRVAGTSYAYSVVITWRNCSDILQSVTLNNPGNNQFEYFIDCAMEGTVETNVYLGLNSISKSVYTIADRNNPTQCSSYNHPSSSTAYIMIWKDCNGNKQTQPFNEYIDAFNFCAQGSAVFQFSPSVTRTSNSCLPYGTFIQEVCYGPNLYYRYADGNGGTYEEFVEGNSITCGYNPYYCSCYGYDCDPYPNPCYYYNCSSCSQP